MTCKYNKTIELTYSYGGHNGKFAGHKYFEDVIQMSRCCLLKPNWYVNSSDFIKLPDIMNYIYRLGGIENPKEKMNHPLCEGNYCNLVPNNEIEEVIVGLSFACNLNCYNCWYRGHHYDSSFQKELYFHTLYNLKGHNLSKIVLTNKGEPFYYNEETMDYLKSLNINDVKKISSVTSGNAFKKDNFIDMSAIKRNTGIDFYFLFSVDAISEDVYRKVRFGGDFQKVLDNIESCINYFGKNNVKVSFTCKEPNMQELPMATQFYQSNFGINTEITFDYYNPELKEIVEKQYGFIK